MPAFRFRLAFLLVLCSGTLLAGQAQGAAERGSWLIQTSVWTTHFTPEPDHDNRQRLINVEWLAPDDYRFDWQIGWDDIPRRSGWLADVRWLAGAATFRNSFSQRSYYVYGGGRYDFVDAGPSRVYGKLTAGLLHGYRGEHRDKIPFNRFGTAPAIVPAFGVEHRGLNLEVIPFGTAGMMLNVGFYLNR